MISRLFLWVPFAVVITVLSGLVYLSVQQDIRSSANDPQIQIAEDVATTLSSGQTPESFSTQNKVDMATSLAPYIIIFDETGKPVTATVELNGKTPEPPAGVLDYARDHGQDRFSWEPASGVRSAAVVSKYHKGFVLAGRSMREIEKREERLEKQVGLAWMVTMFTTLVAVFIFGTAWRKK